MSVEVSLGASGDLVRCCSNCGAVYRKDYRRCANDGLELILTESDPLIGTEVGPYMVTALLGEGAMGRVYRVHHRHLIQKQYALKVLLGDLATTQSMRLRFTKEAESASQLSHRNVVGVIDFGRTEKGLLYLAMELVDGHTLTDLFQSAPMEPGRVIRLARQMAAGLEHAHGMGLIHRDFKPDNILVVEHRGEEIPRIADFGLAISRDADDARLTETGFVMGTAAYIAPEQCTGRPIDLRADLYALGATMFEMLTGGILPFDGPASEVIGSKSSQPAPAIAERAPAVRVPAALADVIAQLLERRPEHRFPDARALIAALDKIDVTTAPLPRTDRHDDTVAETSAPSAAVKHLARGRRGVRGGRGATAVLALVSCALVAVAGWLAYRSLTSDGERPTAGSAPIAAAPQQPATPTAAPVEPARPDVLAAADQVVIEVPSIHDADPARAKKRADSRRTTRPPTQHHDKKPDKLAVARTSETRTALPSGRTPDTRTPDTRTPDSRTPLPSGRTSDKPAEPELPASAPAPPKLLAARVAGLAVDGSLAPAVVRRALDRVSPTLHTCSSTKQETVEVSFSIGEARRAMGTHAGGSSPSAGCIVAAIAGIRTDAAPDVGDVAVRVRVEFAE